MGPKQALGLSARSVSFELPACDVRPSAGISQPHWFPTSAGPGAGIRGRAACSHRDFQQEAWGVSASMQADSEGRMAGRLQCMGMLAGSPSPWVDMHRISRAPWLSQPLLGGRGDRS